MRLKVAIPIMVALVVTGVAFSAHDAAGYCGWCNPTCGPANYHECRTICAEGPALGGGMLGPCYCQEHSSSCAWVMRDIAPDGTLYVRNSAPAPATQVENGGSTRWVGCDGAILARAYEGSELDDVQSRTERIAI
jgi:hypothetical protein